MMHAASASETGVRVDGEFPQPLAPNRRGNAGLSAPASSIDALGAEENTRFLHLVAACAQVTTHYELFRLAQGELQFFLPHDILIAAWGDFSAQEPQFDLVSNLPGVRTKDACNSIVALAKRLHHIWDEGGHQPIARNSSVVELSACHDRPCLQTCAFRDTRLTLVHGICNRRDGYDSLYIALRRRLSITGETAARLRFLADAVIHQIDVAYRLVAALPSGDAAPEERPPSWQLSAREEEITYWVCQGKTNGQIARILGISVYTVKNHVHRIFDKLEANNRTEAVIRYRDMAETAVAGESGLSQPTQRRGVGDADLFAA